ncbi:hypothetical protein Aph02nite_79230 [Actinoplanes philippinensis]|uniref:ABC-2 type transport system permease protein n=1 Tax=Actinoplanes philippinensis TaxID=35752 RepID=A0A1I2KDS0_9ACTN|nr:hypothetical protein [Actinoplanes philippinensis]GIE81973.1 hypothetical protein Aph02nite_79230 [Actinoplanes philippinensis]SFF65114.1 hypothetical protein SAMN05421541_116151 [Actinoplanes philippinensis]
MSAPPASAATAGRARAWTPAARRLGVVEARRMLRHPAYPIVMLYAVMFAVTVRANNEGGPTANFAYSVVSVSVLLIYAPLTFVAANRVAATTYRSQVRDVLDATPVDDRQRTVGAVVGLLLGPVVVGLGGALVLLMIGESASPLAPANDRVYQRTPLEYLQVPAIVLGAGLLGIAVARWLPWPGMLPLTAIALWLGTIVMYDQHFIVYETTTYEVVPARTWFALWPVWFVDMGGMLPRQPLAQEMWHLAYLLGLGVLAGIAALLRTDGPRRALYVTAGGAVVVTAVAAWLQLG